jgi:transcriptional regulator with XRE-family HTH domain
MRHPFGELIRSRREELGITREAIAKHVGRTESWASLVETGKRKPDIDVVPALARALQKDPKALTQLYIQQFHPGVARVLFDVPAPEVSDQQPSVTDSEICRSLAELPDDIRGEVERLVRTLHGHYSAPPGFD